MKKLCVSFVLLLGLAVLGAQEHIINTETYASYYGEAFDGRLTASGEVFDSTKMTAAHRTLPFGTFVEVTNLDNGRRVVVRINDRGPFVEKRSIDVSKGAAAVLDMLTSGIARVSIKAVPNPALAAATVNPVPNAGLTTPVATMQPTTPYPAPAASRYPQTTQYSAGGQSPYGYNTARATVYTPTTSAETSGPLWRIQIGAFTREENALRLVVSLRKIGFEPAYEKSEQYVRVVLYGIRPDILNHVVDVLNANRITDYIIRQEAW